METTQVCQVCAGLGSRPVAWKDPGVTAGNVSTVCQTCAGTGFITTTSTLTRDEQRFELIKVALTGMLANPHDIDTAFDLIAERAVVMADAQLARSDADAKKEPQ